MIANMGRTAQAPQLEDALRPLVEKLVEQILARHGPTSGWITHAQSPLGRVKTAALCRSGALPAKRIRGTKLWMIRLADLDAYIEKNAVDGERVDDEACASVERDLDAALSTTPRKRSA